MPLLENIKSVSDFFIKLFTFSFLDFQPIRDITFLIDLKIYQIFHFNSAVWQNLFWWIASCGMIGRLIVYNFPKLSSRTILAILLLFLVYPLFSQSVGWGVARKHILALFFIVATTDIWLRKFTSLNWKSTVVLSALYACAALSQPICILWPFWAFVHLLLMHPALMKKSFKFCLPIFFIFILVAALNYLYYELSPVFLSNYKSITKNSFNLADCILAFGHYVFQIFVPYLLAYRYTLGHWSTVAGLIIFGAFVLLIRGLKVEGKWAISWGIFSILPLVMALTNPTAQFDTYVLIPSVGTLILCISLAERLPKIPQKVLLSLSVTIFVIWVGVTNIESRTWKDELLMVKIGFERRPSCLSAADYLKISYENEKSGPKDAKDFIFNFECDKFSYSGKRMIILQSYMLFYENDLPRDQRIERLKYLSELDFFPKTVLASLYLKLKMNQEADEEIASLEEKWKGANFLPEYIPIIANHLAPYCRKAKKSICVKITEGFTKKASSIFYK